MPIPFKLNLPGITYAKATPENEAVASNPTGGVASDLKDLINPITLATGKITTVQGNTSVVGIGVEFDVDFQVGDYLYAFDVIDTTPTLVGKIVSVSSSTMILSAGAPSTISAPGRYAGKTNVLLSTQEDIIMRVPTVIQGQTLYIPNWKEWLKGSKVFGSFNQEATNRLERFSLVGVPTEEAPSAQNIQYTITPYYPWASRISIGAGGSRSTLYFPSSSAFPNFVYAKINPFGTAADNLPSNTLFRLFVNSEFNQNCIVAGVDYPATELQAAGYFA